MEYLHKSQKDLARISRGSKRLATSVLSWTGDWRGNPTLSTSDRRLSQGRPIIGRQNKLNVKNKVTFYNMMIKPVMTYAALVCGYARSKLIDMFQVVQISMLLEVTYAPWFIKISARIPTPGWSGTCATATTRADTLIREIYKPLWSGFTLLIQISKF